MITIYCFGLAILLLAVAVIILAMKIANLEKELARTTNMVTTMYTHRSIL